MDHCKIPSEDLWFFRHVVSLMHPNCTYVNVGNRAWLMIATADIVIGPKLPVILLTREFRHQEPYIPPNLRSSLQYEAFLLLPMNVGAMALHYGNDLFPRGVKMSPYPRDYVILQGY